MQFHPVAHHALASGKVKTLGNIRRSMPYWHDSKWIPIQRTPASILITDSRTSLRIIPKKDHVHNLVIKTKLLKTVRSKEKGINCLFLEMFLQRKIEKIMIIVATYIP